MEGGREGGREKALDLFAIFIRHALGIIRVAHIIQRQKACGRSCLTVSTPLVNSCLMVSTPSVVFSVLNFTLLLTRGGPRHFSGMGRVAPR